MSDGVDENKLKNTSRMNKLLIFWELIPYSLIRKH